MVEDHLPANQLSERELMDKRRRRFQADLMVQTRAMGRELVNMVWVVKGESHYKPVFFVRDGYPPKTAIVSGSVLE